MENKIVNIYKYALGSGGLKLQQETHKKTIRIYVNMNYSSWPKDAYKKHIAYLKKNYVNKD